MGFKHPHLYIYEEKHNESKLAVMEYTYLTDLNPVSQFSKLTV